MCQGEGGKSFGVYELTVMGRLLHVAKQPHSVVRTTVGTLTCSGGCRCLGVFREELSPVLPASGGFRLRNSSFDGRNVRRTVRPPPVKGYLGARTLLH